MLQAFACTDHDGHYPVGVASVVFAEDEAQARALLAAELREHGLKDERFTLRRLNSTKPKAFVLQDGDY